MAFVHFIERLRDALEHLTCESVVPVWTVQAEHGRRFRDVEGDWHDEQGIRMVEEVCAPRLLYHAFVAHLQELQVAVTGSGLHECTEEVASVVRASGIRTGLCTVFVRHTSASLIIQENADPSARRDMESWLNRLVPEGDSIYTHVDEGPDDMPAHIKSLLTSVSVSVPVLDGALALGTWQGIYLWEHRRARSTRSIIVTVSD